MVNNTVYQFVGSNLGIEIFLKKREHQKKGALKQKSEASLTVCIGVSRKFHLHYCTKNKVSYEGFLSKYDQILKKPLMENFIFRAVHFTPMF